MSDNKVVPIHPDAAARSLEQMQAMRQMHRASLHLLKEATDPRIAAAEATAAAALMVLQHWTSWAAITAMADAGRHPQPGSLAQMQEFAEAGHEALSNATDNIRTMWQAWEQLDAAVITWSELSGIKRSAA